MMLFIQSLLLDLWSCALVYGGLMLLGFILSYTSVDTDDE